MRRSLGRRLFLQAVAVLCYLAGMVLFLAVAMRAVSAPGERLSFGPGSGVALLASVALLAVGVLLTVWAGGVLAAVRDAGPGPDRGSPRSALASMGYQVSSAEGDAGPRVLTDDGEVRIRCPECDATNDPSYTYCQDCSGRLPE